jgi:hypothetical protein
VVYNPDISDDLLVVDNLDTLTLKVTGKTDVVLSKCILTEPIEYREPEPTYGQVLQADQLFIWPTSRSDRPPLGSVLVDEDDIYWTILTLRHKKQVETWEAHGRDLSILPGEAGLENIATILKATYTKGDDNEAKAVWVGYVSGETTPTDNDKVEARFQPSIEMAQLFTGADFSRLTYRVIFQARAPVELAGGQYRLIDSSGYRYRVMQYHDEQRLDRLPIAIAVRILEGTEYWDQGPPSGP